MVGWRGVKRRLDMAHGPVRGRAGAAGDAGPDRGPLKSWRTDARAAGRRGPAWDAGIRGASLGEMARDRADRWGSTSGPGLPGSESDRGRPAHPSRTSAGCREPRRKVQRHRRAAGRRALRPVKVPTTAPVVDVKDQQPTTRICRGELIGAHLRAFTAWRWWSVKSWVTRNTTSGRGGTGEDSLQGERSDPARFGPGAPRGSRTRSPRVLDLLVEETTSRRRRAEVPGCATRLALAGLRRGPPT